MVIDECSIVGVANGIGVNVCWQVWLWGVGVLVICGCGMLIN